MHYLFHVCIAVSSSVLLFFCPLFVILLSFTNKHVEEHTIFRSLDTLLMLIGTSVTMAMRDERRLKVF